MSRSYTVSTKISLIEDAKEKRRDDVSFSQDVTENTEQDLIVVFGASDVAVNMGGVSNAKLLIITTDLKVTVKINSSLVALPISKQLIVTGDATDSITSISISNASADTDANVRIIVGE